MKWVIYLTGITVCLSAGYWAGSEKATNDTPPIINRTLPTTHKDRRATIKQTTSTTLLRPTTAYPDTIKPSNTLTDTPLIEIFSFHLMMNNYEDAAAILYDMDRESIEHNNLRKHYVTDILTKLSEPQKNSANISNSLAAYLANFYDDTNVLLLQASYYVSLSEYFEAINTLQQANNYAYSPEQKNNILQMYTKTIQHIDTQLSQREEWGRLTDIYRHAEYADLLLEADTFRLAELYLLQGKIYLAEEYLSTLSDKVEWLDKISALLPKQEKTEKTEKTEKNNTTSVSLKKTANQFVIATQLSGHSTHLLIDTGASLTTISKDYYESIRRSSKFVYLQKQIFLTANGKANGEIYTVDSMEIGGHTLRNIEIAVLDFPTSKHNSGLLGMNALQHFKFEIDQKNSLLILERNPQ
jgi:clan AA aspartic protease (TIGR02281 family)